MAVPGLPQGDACAPAALALTLVRSALESTAARPLLGLMAERGECRWLPVHPPAPPHPRAGAPGVCPHTLCFTRTRTLFRPWGIWNGATAGALHNSRHAEKDAGCLGCGLQPATCDLRPAQRKPRGALPRAPTHRKMRGSEVLGHCIRRGLLQRKSSWTTARCRAHAGFPSHAPQGHEGALAPRPTDPGATYCRAPCAQCWSLDGERRAAEHALCAVASEPSGQRAGPPGGRSTKPRAGRRPGGLLSHRGARRLPRSPVSCLPARVTLAVPWVRGPANRRGAFRVREHSCRGPSCWPLHFSVNRKPAAHRQRVLREPEGWRVDRVTGG